MMRLRLSLPGIVRVRAEIFQRRSNLLTISIESLRAGSPEQTCPHIKIDGTPDTLTTCNFFTHAADGRFQRVIIWIDGTNPLIGE